jgi:glycosyltransferase involved in cell wall biosynthesis
VDDGSTDGSAQVAMEYGAKVLSTGGRLGPASARNIGAQAASGAILLFVDADVSSTPTPSAESRLSLTMIPASMR